jgi:hypothetical protein
MKTHKGTRLCRGLFLLFYVGITGLLSASVFGLVIVSDGGSCFIDTKGAIARLGEGSVLFSFLVFLGEGKRTGYLNLLRLLIYKDFYAPLSEEFDVGTFE